MSIWKERYILKIKLLNKLDEIFNDNGYYELYGIDKDTLSDDLFNEFLFYKRLIRTNVETAIRRLIEFYNAKLNYDRFGRLFDYLDVCINNEIKEEKELNDLFLEEYDVFKLKDEVKINRNLKLKDEVKINTKLKYLCNYVNSKKRIKNTFRLNRSGLCVSCNEMKVNSNHHIIPRTYGGKNNKENLLGLCSSCHDRIEIQTDEWINSRNRMDVDLFRSLITNGVW